MSILVKLFKILHSPAYDSMYPHWKDWYWSWNSNTLATWWEELTHWQRPWPWERLKAGVEGGDRGWDGWMSSPTRHTWVWVNSRSWWWTGRPGVLRFMGSQRVGHDWATSLHLYTHIFGCSLEGLMLKLKLQYFGHLMRRTLIGKDPDAGKDWGQEEKGTTEDEMVGWHHRLNGHGFE